MPGGAENRETTKGFNKCCDESCALSVISFGVAIWFLVSFFFCDFFVCVCVCVSTNTHTHNRSTFTFEDHKNKTKKKEKKPKQNVTFINPLWHVCNTFFGRRAMAHTFQKPLKSYTKAENKKNKINQKKTKHNINIIIVNSVSTKKK